MSRGKTKVVQFNDFRRNDSPLVHLEWVDSFAVKRVSTSGQIGWQGRFRLLVEVCHRLAGLHSIWGPKVNADNESRIKVARAIIVLMEEVGITHVDSMGDQPNFYYEVMENGISKTVVTGKPRNLK